jgi:EpsI family protein
MDKTTVEHPTNLSRRANLLLVSCALASAGGWWLSPASRPQANHQQPARLQLGSLFPSRFGEWGLAPTPTRGIAPDTEALLNKLYTEILERVYVDAQGHRVMLSVAYGADQRGGLEAHKPEVCYPAQGFSILRNENQSLQTAFGSVPVKRLFAMAENRPEPITYWFTMSERHVNSRWEKRWVELELMLTGRIPDGLLVRISSIDPSPDTAWNLHDRFARDLLSVLTPAQRSRVAGLA